MGAHTKGDWIVAGWTVYAENRPLAVAYSDYLADTIQDAGLRESNERSKCGEAEAAANAILMAAAPKMLAALRQAVRDRDLMPYVERECRAAIEAGAPGTQGEWE